MVEELSGRETIDIRHDIRKVDLTSGNGGS
jgi:hypothetical protein